MIYLRLNLADFVARMDVTQIKRKCGVFMRVKCKRLRWAGHVALMED